MIALTRITGSAFGLSPIRLLILKPPSMLMLLKEPTICSTASPLPNGNSSRS